MLIFNCTKSTEEFFTVTRKGEKRTIVEIPASKEIGKDDDTLQYEDGTPALPMHWVLHTVSIKRKKCLIAMELETRFCVVVTDMKKGDADVFLENFKAFYVPQVLTLGVEAGIWQETNVEEIVGACFSHLNSVRFFQRSNRSVQTQINEVVRILKYEVEGDLDLLSSENVSLLYFNQDMNTMLRKSVFFDRSVIPVEEMLSYWQFHYEGASSKAIAAAREKIREAQRKKYRGGGFEQGPGEEPVASTFEEESSGLLLPGSDPLNEDDLGFLDGMLLKYQTDASLENVSALHGFLTAIVSGPNAMPPSQWLHEVWGGGEESQPDWKNMDEVQRFMTATFSMMNNIAQTLREKPDEFAAVFTGDEQQSSVSDWCFGYMAAVALDEDWWNMPEDMVSQLNELDVATFMVPVSGTISAREMIDRNSRVIDTAVQLHAYWLNRRTLLNPSARIDSDSPMMSEKLVSTPQQPAVSQKTGRNDPCPCGSGKKFKKCCLH